MDAFHVLQPQVFADLPEEVHPLALGVQQGQLNGGLQDFQGKAREARPGPHVHHGFPPEVRQGQQGGAVQEVEPGHPGGVRDGGEVHHLIFLRQKARVPRQGRDALRGEGEGGQPLPENGLHHLAFNRSRISVSSCSSAEGPGGGGGGAASFFLWKRLRAFTRQKTTKAMMRKFKTAWIKLP